MTQQIDERAGGETFGVRLRTPFGLAESLEITLSSGQQKQSVGGNSHRRLSLNAVRVTNLSLPDTEKGFFDPEN
jgi:hypothetical protein